MVLGPPTCGHLFGQPQATNPGYKWALAAPAAEATWRSPLSILKNERAARAEAWRWAHTRPVWHTRGPGELGARPGEGPENSSLHSEGASNVLNDHPEEEGRRAHCPDPSIAMRELKLPPSKSGCSQRKLEVCAISCSAGLTHARGLWRDGWTPCALLRALPGRPWAFPAGLLSHQPDPSPLTDGPRKQ